MSLVIIDTSVWIEYLRVGSQLSHPQVDAALRSDEAVITGVILGEVLCGARDRNDFATLDRVVGGLHCLEDDRELYREAADLAWQLRARGIRIPLSDLTIAAHSLRRAIPILTQDGHFKLIESAIGKPLLWTP